MRFSCDNATWTNREAYATPKTDFDIKPTVSAYGCGTNDGSRTVYVQYNDSLTNTDSSYNTGAFNLDTTAPSIPGKPATSSLTTNTKPTWSWTSSTDSDSGLAATPYSVQWCSNSSFTGCDSNTDTSTTNSYTHSVALADGTWYFRVKATDTAGNSSAYSSNGPDTINTATTTSTSNSNSSTPGCTNQAPGVKAPWLYGAIAQDSDSILLYFTEADNPVSQYVLEFGPKSGDYLYGVQDMGVNIRGQMTYLVKSLSPNTTYYFKVRGGNGCATGPWSNEISSKTKSNIEVNQLDFISSTLETVPAPELQPTTETEAVTLPGYYVKVIVTDKNKEPVVGATVTLHSTPQTSITDKNGIAAFKNVEAGNHKVLIAYNNFEGEQSINLTGDVKEFNLNVTIQQKTISLSPLAYAIIGIMGLIIIMLIIVIFRLRSRKA